MEKEAQKFVDEFMAGIVAKNAGEPEFHQAVKEVAESLAEYIVMNPVLSKMKVLERIAEPERVIIFRVPWLNDKGEMCIRDRENSFATTLRSKAAAPPASRPESNARSAGSRAAVLPPRKCRSTRPRSMPRAAEAPA